MLMSQVYPKVLLLREKMKVPLTARELKPVGRTKKEPTWTIEIRQASRRMVIDKLIRRTKSPFGWEITGKGLKWIGASAWLVSSINEDDPTDQNI
jgi:hypothetical protein